ncbi:hypothetical protein J1N35_023032 [Gossypium stocksii]|uniref:Protein kinase domain-containing protein n=1 Tax=Gossypium stocksii TaxID=47602 RepID=A0A9D4A1P8_9ROSI|nr:hypothetical protein J1N35_023032 [Gossypium stocksii]
MMKHFLLYYRPPKLIFGAIEYATAIGIWTAGYVLAELLLGQHLFAGESGVDQVVEIIKEKLKDKKAEYESIASTDSFVNLEDIDNRIITEVLGPERYGRVRFQGSGVNPTQYFRPS